MSGPGLFSDIGKRSRDLLKNGYISHQKVMVSTKSEDIGVSSTVSMKGEVAAGHLDASYKFKKIMTNAKLDTEFGNISTTFIMDDILPSTKTIASLTFPHNLSGKVEAQFFSSCASLSGGVALKESSSSIELSGTMGVASGRPGRSVGFEACIDLKTKAFTDYRAGVSLSKENWCASMILSDRGDIFNVSYLQQMSKSVGVLEMSHTFSTDRSVFTCGGSRAFDGGLLKAKVNSECVVGGVLALDLDAVVRRVVFSGEFDATKLNHSPTFGLSLVVEP